MRELGVSEKWAKLKQPTWTTFRLTRRDRDWEVGEVVRVVYKPRTKQREILGTAKIIGKEVRTLKATRGASSITQAEAIEDGFKGFFDMYEWLLKRHGERVHEVMNKLTLSWSGIPPYEHLSVI